MEGQNNEEDLTERSKVPFIVILSGPGSCLDSRLISGARPVLAASPIDAAKLAFQMNAERHPDADTACVMGEDQSVFWIRRTKTGA